VTRISLEYYNTTLPLYHAVVIMRFQAILFWDDGTNFNVELWACSKFIEPSILVVK
jgi:hypothetical protein